MSSTVPRAPVIARAVQPGDRDVWDELFREYREFYKFSYDAKVHDTVWNWLLPHAPLHPHFPFFGGLLACDAESGLVIGLAHYRSSLDTLTAVQTGFLHDLYVRPQERGRGVGALLLKSVAELGHKENWSKIEWMTANDNHAAQRLYNTFGQFESHWLTYEMPVPANM